MIDAQKNLIKQEYIYMISYYELLKELSLLSKTILSDENKICKIDKVPNYIIDKHAENENIDSSGLNQLLIAEGKGPLNIIKNINEEEDKEASRRIVVTIIKR